MKGADGFLSSFDPLPEGLPPRVLLAYEPESCLSAREGRSVWRMRRRADGAPFVLKISRDGTEDLPEEFRILTRLAPLVPGAVPAPVDCFREGGESYLLREYLPGETLARYREREGGCAAKQCVRLGRKLCALLERLHGMEPPVIHRDVKPENIILLPDGGVGLIDFGIARRYREGQEQDTRRLGTRSTAAPEQYGYAQTDRRTDLYALGVTLIWLLSGSYDRDSLRRAPGVPERLRRVLERAVSFAPEDRYQDAVSFSAALAGKRPGGGRRAAGRIAAVLAAAVFLCICLGGLLERRAVPFPSGSMERAVRAELGQPEGAVTYGDLRRVERLAIVGETPFGAEEVFDYRTGCYLNNVFLGETERGDIADLSLLADMPNLRELYLCRQEICDLSPLEGLHLTVLALCENRITDVSPLAGLTELETLYLGGNPAADYTPLSGLAGLRLLDLDGSPEGAAVAESFDFLKNLSLRELSLGRTFPRDGDWSPLALQAGLDTLHLWEPPQEALAAANALTGLRVLVIGNYTARDLSPLSGLARLEVLSIFGGLESLEGAGAMPALTTLALGGSPVSDLSPLAGMPRLNYLHFTDLPVQDFSPLAELPGLTYVQVNADQAAAVEAACPGHAFRLAFNSAGG